MPKTSADASTKSTPAERIFADEPIGWGRKYAHSTRLIDIWREDRSYLLFGANLLEKRCDSPLPGPAKKLVELVNIYEGPKKSSQPSLDQLVEDLESWRNLSQHGKGLEDLPRPTPKECQTILASATVLAGHSDFDGLYSMAIAIAAGGALSGSRGEKYRGLRVLRYGFRSLDDYTTHLALEKSSVAVVVDFAAHPDVTLTIDHHSTSLSYWDFGQKIPTGIFDPPTPSCPSVLNKFCGLKVSPDLLRASDMIDGAIFPNVEAAHNLDDSFIGLSYALGLDASDPILKKVVITLAENKLDPDSVLREPVWAARVELLRHELVEQRRFWDSASRFSFPNQLLAVADSRESPYPAARFRYLPFENSETQARPYLLTVRGITNRGMMLLGLSRNPFYSDKAFFEKHPFDVGAYLASIGEGGGRREVGSVAVVGTDLKSLVQKIALQIEASATGGQKP